MTMTDYGLLVVFGAATITALATGLGALPLLFARRIGEFWIAMANAAAAGLMLAACHALIAEGVAISAERLLVGMLIGVAGIVLSQRLIADGQVTEIAQLKGLDARKALLIIGVMTAHSFAEGIGVGVSFGGSSEMATFISTAIAIHNIPEGLAIALVLVPRGTPVWQAALWGIFSSLPQPLMAVPAYLFVETFHPLLPVGFGIAAGAMFWMVFAELLPDANAAAKPNQVALGLTLSFSAMIAFQYLALK